MSESRVVVKLADFLRVTVADRETIDTPTKAAEALGMTEASFKQRLVRERKNYPAIFETVPKYTASRVATPDEAQAMLDKILAERESEGSE